MAYQILKNARFIELRFDGHHNAAQALAGCEAAAAEMKKADCLRVLADLSGVELLDVNEMDIFDVHSALPDIFPRGTKLAGVIPDGRTSDFNMQFAETVTVNRGLSFRFFKQRTEAEEWLEVEE